MEGSRPVHIHSEEFGDGDRDSIVLVHGWGVDGRRNWVDSGWVSALQPIRRVVLLDVRGHGRSDKPHEQRLYGYRAMSEDVVHVLDRLGIERADLLGYSLGSFVGAALLGSHAHRFRSMILGGIGEETEQSAAMGAVIAAALRADDPTTIDDPIGRAYRRFVDADVHNDREALALGALEMWPDGHPLELGGEGLREADVPVLVVNGEDDHPYVDSAHHLVDALRDGRMITIPGADHLTALFDPRFRDAALEFLQERRG